MDELNDAEEELLGLLRRVVDKKSHAGEVGLIRCTAK